jgi:tetratricopeptide (TPR) repeat protein
MLAEIYYKVSRRDKEAMALLREGLEIAPGHKEFSRKYAQILAARGEYEAAAKVLLNRGLPDIKTDREALELLAGLYTRLDEFYLAAQTYRNLLATWPNIGAYWFSLGSVLEDQRQTGEAIRCYKKALETGNLSRDLMERSTQRITALAQPPA